MSLGKILSGVSSSSGLYSIVQHAPPYREITENRRSKRQIWDGVGVIAATQDPELIKSAYLGIYTLKEPLVISPPVVIYEAEANRIGVRAAHVFLSKNAAIVVNRYGIQFVANGAKRKPTKEEIDAALEHIKRFGSINYRRAAMEYREVKDALGGMRAMQTLETVNVSEKIEDMLKSSYLKN